MRAVSCIFRSYFDIIKNEIRKINPYLIQNSISHCLDNLIPKEDTRKRGERLSKDKTLEDKEILPRIGILRDRYRY